jgi:hypothetical protein
MKMMNYAVIPHKLNVNTIRMSCISKKAQVKAIYDYKNLTRLDSMCRLQWPRGLRHELSSPAKILGLWVRIPLEAWMFVFILCLLCPVCR